MKKIVVLAILFVSANLLAGDWDVTNTAWNPSCVIADKMTHDFWVGAEDRGVLIAERASGSSTRLSTSLSGWKVRDMKFDDAGNLWIGSASGIARWDLAEKKWYNVPWVNSKTSGGTDIMAVAVAKDRLAVATPIGLFVYSGDLDQAGTNDAGWKASVTGIPFHRIAMEANGTVWGINTQKIYRVSTDGVVASFGPGDPGSPLATIQDSPYGVSVAPDGKIWVNAGLTLACYDNSSKSWTAKIETGITGSPVVVDAANKVWYLVRGMIAQYNPATKETKQWKYSWLDVGGDLGNAVLGLDYDGGVLVGGNKVIAKFTGATPVLRPALSRAVGQPFEFSANGLIVNKSGNYAISILGMDGRIARKSAGYFEAGKPFSFVLSSGSYLVAVRTSDGLFSRKIEVAR